MDEPIWTPTGFTKNRDRLLNQEIARSFFRRLVERAQVLMSDDHFTVDGTLIEAWARQKSFSPRRARRRATAATLAASSGGMTRTRRRPTRTRSCTAGRSMGRRAWRIRGTC
jgi:hypothetical protein